MIKKNELWKPIFKDVNKPRNVKKKKSNKNQKRRKIRLIQMIQDRLSKYIKENTDIKGETIPKLKIIEIFAQHNLIDGKTFRGTGLLNDRIHQIARQIWTDIPEELEQKIIKLPKKKIDVKTNDFLATYEWRKLRYEVIKKYGRKCMCCGLTPDDGIKIHVDHIKPRKTHPELALDINNLQLLCEICNHGKGNWDESDWRKQSI